MKFLVSSLCFVALLLALAAVPASAAPWCSTYCSCTSHCWTQCYDPSGASACDFYLCDEYPQCGFASTTGEPTVLDSLALPELQAPSQDPQLPAKACTAAEEPADA
jgi:hypothetical protein